MTGSAAASWGTGCPLPPRSYSFSQNVRKTSTVVNVVASVGSGAVGCRSKPTTGVPPYPEPAFERAEAGPRTPSISTAPPRRTAPSRLIAFSRISATSIRGWVTPKAKREVRAPSRPLAGSSVPRPFAYHTHSSKSTHAQRSHEAAHRVGYLNWANFTRSLTWPRKGIGRTLTMIFTAWWYRAFVALPVGACRALWRSASSRGFE